MWAAGSYRPAVLEPTVRLRSRWYHQDFAAKDFPQHIRLLRGAPAFQREIPAPHLGDGTDVEPLRGEPGGDPFHRRGVAPVEAVGDPEHAGEPPYYPLLRFGEPGELFVLEAGSSAAVVPAYHGHQVALPGGKVEPLGVHDELEAVLVMLPVAHHLSHVVQQAGSLQDCPLILVGAQHAAEPVEQGEPDYPDLLYVPPVPLAALHELPHGPERIAGPRSALSDHLQQQPLAQPERAHHDAAGFHQAEQLEIGRASCRACG